MKMVKSLLLVSAAGLVASAGAQAADLPVKAKPVEYVKVCSLYGAGFYYIPGTDICLKVCGYVRYQANYGTSSITAGPFAGAQHLQQPSWRRRTSAMRARTIIGIDTPPADGIRHSPCLYEHRLHEGHQRQRRLRRDRRYRHADVRQPRVHPAGWLHLGSGNVLLRLRVDGGRCLQRRLHACPGHRRRWPACCRLHGHTGQRRFGELVDRAEPQKQHRQPQHSAALRRCRPLASLGDNLSPNVTTFAVVAGTNNRPATCLTSSATSASTRLGVRRSSPVLCITSAAGYYATAAFACPGVVAEPNGHPSDKWGWAISPGLKINFPMIGPGDYFQGAFVLHPRCHPVCVEYAGRWWCAGLLRRQPVRVRPSAGCGLPGQCRGHLPLSSAAASPTTRSS